MKKSQKQVTDARMASIDLTLESWGSYKSNSKVEDDIIAAHVVQRILLEHEKHNEVVLAVINKVLQKSNTPEKYKINIRINRVSSYEIMEEILTALADYRSPHAELELQMLEGDFYSQTRELQTLLCDNLRANLIESDVVSATMLHDYLKIRAKASSYTLLHTEESLEELFRQGHRNYYGVIVDEGCLPIADTREPANGFFEMVSTQLIVAERERKAA